MSLSAYDTGLLSRAPRPESSHVTQAVTFHSCPTLGPRETASVTRAVPEAGVSLLSVALLTAPTGREILRIPRRGLWWPAL